MNLADSLKRFRRELNVTQKQASSIVGVSERSYGEYERGTAKIPASAILKLADTFGVSADYLLGRTDTPNFNDTEQPPQWTNPQLRKSGVRLWPKSTSKSP